jgi:MFS transporter, PPP family, 3-phenylpropionic acid transporter
MNPLGRLRRRLPPAVRGALYYLGYWGVVGAYIPFLYVHFARLGLSGAEIGALAAIFPLMTLTVGPPVAALADRRGWRVRIIAVAIVGLAAALALLALPRSFAPLVPLMVLMSLFRCPIAPIGDSLVVRMAARHRLDYGRMRLWGSLGFALVAVVCGAVWQRVGFTPMFFVAGALFLPVALFALLLEEGPVVERTGRRSLGVLARDPALVALLGATILAGASLGVSGTFEGILMDALGGGEFLIGLLLGVTAFSELPAMRYGGAIARRLRGAPAILIGYGLILAAHLGYALADSPGLLLALATLKGCGFGLFFVLTIRLVDERAPDEWSATAQAIMVAGAWGLAPLIAGPLAGLVYDAYGVQAVFAACAAAVVLAALVLAGATLAGVFERPGDAEEERAAV